MNVFSPNQSLTFSTVHFKKQAKITILAGIVRKKQMTRRRPDIRFVTANATDNTEIHHSQHIQDPIIVELPNDSSDDDTSSNAHSSRHPHDDVVKNIVLRDDQQTKTIVQAHTKPTVAYSVTEEFVSLTEGLAASTVATYQRIWRRLFVYAYFRANNAAIRPIPSSMVDDANQSITVDQIIRMAQSLFSAPDKASVDPLISNYMKHVAQLSASTRNTHRAAILCLNRYAIRRNWCPWRDPIAIPEADYKAYRHIQGPQPETVITLLNYYATQATQLSGKKAIKALRWYALTTLLATSGLRCAEALRLTVKDFHPAELTIDVIGKGRVSSEPIELSQHCVEAIQTWLDKAKILSGPIFCLPGRPTPLNSSVVRAEYQKRNAQLFDLKGHVHAHGFRHSAITMCLEANNGNLVKTQKFSRHADPKVIDKYNDKREGVQREGANAISMALGLSIRNRVEPTTSKEVDPKTLAPDTHQYCDPSGLNNRCLIRSMMFLAGRDPNINTEVEEIATKLKKKVDPETAKLITGKNFLPSYLIAPLMELLEIDKPVAEIALGNPSVLRYIWTSSGHTPVRVSISAPLPHSLILFGNGVHFTAARSTAVPEEHTVEDESPVPKKKKTVPKKKKAPVKKGKKIPRVDPTPDSIAPTQVQVDDFFAPHVPKPVLAEEPPKPKRPTTLGEAARNATKNK